MKREIASIIKDNTEGTINDETTVDRIVALVQSLQAQTQQKSAFFYISDQIDKLNAAVKGTAGLTLFVDYSQGLVIKLTVVQPATEKVHSFTVIITPDMMKNDTRSDEEKIVELFAPIFNALNSIQTVKSVTGGILLDTNGNPLHSGTC